MIRASRTLAAAMLFLAWAGMAGAEGNPFGGFKIDSSAPIEVVADALEVRQAEQLAIFSGAVEATQGALTIRADRIEVTYGEASDQGPGRIRLMKASGNVMIASGANTARADWAEYDVPRGVIRMGGKVVLARGRNVVKGARLVMDLNTGVGRIEGSGSGRVKSIFAPPSGGGDKKTDGN